MGSLALKEEHSGVKPFGLLRDEMVARNIAARGVRDELVLDAMRKVPRELFLPQKLREFAYEDSVPSHGSFGSRALIVGRVIPLMIRTPG